MLIRHTLQYLLAKGAPGAVNFLAIILYTRAVTPESYGLYALAVTAVSFCNVVCSQWVQLSLLRFYPANRENPDRFLATMLVALVLSNLPVILAGTVTFIIVQEASARILVLIAIPLVCAQAWFDLNLELARSQLDTLRYGLMAAARAVGGLAAGLILVYFGFGAEGLLAGLLVGCLLGSLLSGFKPWGSAFKALANREALRPYLSYGLPLTMTFAMAFVVSGSDRLLLTYYLGPEATGLYSAGYDLVWNLLTLLFVVVNLAAYPLVVRALEMHGREEASRQCAENGTLLLFAALPTTALFVFYSSDVTAVLLGLQYQAQAAQVIPWIALSALIGGIRAYHFDLAFQLSKKTVYQFWILGAAAAANFLLNMILIPAFGAVGAAYATLVAYGISLLLSVAFGRRCFPIGFQWSAVARMILASSMSIGAIALIPGPPDLLWILIAACVGASVYIAMGVALNLFGIRKVISERLR